MDEDSSDAEFMDLSKQTILGAATHTWRLPPCVKMVHLWDNTLYVCAGSRTMTRVYTFDVYTFDAYTGQRTGRWGGGYDAIHACCVLQETGSVVVANDGVMDVWTPHSQPRRWSVLDYATQRDDIRCVADVGNGLVAVADYYGVLDVWDVRVDHHAPITTVKIPLGVSCMVAVHVEGFEGVLTFHRDTALLCLWEPWAVQPRVVWQKESGWRIVTCMLALQWEDDPDGIRYGHVALGCNDGYVQIARITPSGLDVLYQWCCGHSPVCAMRQISRAGADTTAPQLITAVMHGDISVWRWGAASGIALLQTVPRVFKMNNIALLPHGQLLCVGDTDTQCWPAGVWSVPVARAAAWNRRLAALTAWRNRCTF